MRTEKLKSTKMCRACHSQRATAIEESCDIKRFFTSFRMTPKANTGEMCGAGARRFARRTFDGAMR